MKFVATKAFDATVDVLKIVAEKILNDSHKCFKNTYPSDSWVHSFRFHHPEAVTLCRMENKSAAEILAKHP